MKPADPDEIYRALARGNSGNAEKNALNPCIERKFIRSLRVMSELMSAANRRNINFVTAMDDPSAGIKT